MAPATTRLSARGSSTSALANNKQRRAAFAPARTSAVSCRASAAKQQDAAPARRELLIGGAAAAAAAALQAASAAAPRAAAAATREMPVSSLSTFQRAAQRRAFQEAAEGALRPLFAAADAPGLVALALHDAATYDADAKAGGFDGSILLSPEELSRPENARLKPLAQRLQEAKRAVDAAVPAGSGPISNADLIVLAVKVATRQAWKAEKLKKTVTTSGGDIIADVYGTDWPVRLGRLDAATPGAGGRIPDEAASAADVKAFMAALGVKSDAAAATGPFAKKPPFWERPTFVLWPAATADPAATEARLAEEDPAAFAGPKADYDRSRKTLTRTDYEVDFINFFERLTSLGATFNPDAYLAPETTLKLKF